jgi:hypothetical protein
MLSLLKTCAGRACEHGRRAFEVEHQLGVWAGSSPHMGSRRSEFAHVVQDRANEKCGYLREIAWQLAAAN